MWLPAVAPFASAHHYRLVLAWLGLCSPAKLDLHYVKVGDPKNCNIFRANIVREITSLKPALVLLSGRNTLIPKSRTVFFTNAEWAVGYEQTIHALKTKNTKVAVIEDSVTFDSSVPACLSVHVTSVHRCAVKDPNWFAPALTAGEISATKFEHVAYIKTHPWLCTKWCSPVIGSFIVYSDADHLTFSYTHFLSRVMGADIAAVLK